MCCAFWDDPEEHKRYNCKQTNMQVFGFKPLYQKIITAHYPPSLRIHLGPLLTLDCQIGRSHNLTIERLFGCNKTSILQFKLVFQPWLQMTYQRRTRQRSDGVVLVSSYQVSDSAVEHQLFPATSCWVKVNARRHQVVFSFVFLVFYAQCKHSFWRRCQAFILPWIPAAAAAHSATCCANVGWVVHESSWLAAARHHPQRQWGARQLEPIAGEPHK